MAYPGDSIHLGALAPRELQWVGGHCENTLKYTEKLCGPEFYAGSKNIGLASEGSREISPISLISYALRGDPIG